VPETTPITIGRIEALFRYPVKSMRGEPLRTAMLGWGGALTFGDADDAPVVAVTMRDVRCAMVNLDPDEGSPAPEMLKAVVRANQNNAGIYGTVTRTGRLAIGQTVSLKR
jgi:uncharacterized protein YcbX